MINYARATQPLYLKTALSGSCVPKVLRYRRTVSISAQYYCNPSISVPVVSKKITT